MWWAGLAPGLTGGGVVLLAGGRPAVAVIAGLAAGLAGGLTAVGAVRRSLGEVVGPVSEAARVIAAELDAPREAPTDPYEDARRVASGVTELVRRFADERTVSQQREERFRRAVEHLGAALASSHDRTAIIGALTETAALAVGADRAVFWGLRGRSLAPVAVHPPGDPPGRLRRDEGLAGRAAAAGQVTTDDGRCRHPLEGAPGPGLAVPMVSTRGLLGVLGLYRSGGADPFRPVEVGTVTTLVAQAARAVENAFLHEEAARLSVTDGLTGVWNRRQFDLRCAEELERSRRFGDPFAVLMVDVDRFKHINDTYGHRTGDAVLVELAARLDASKREVDLLARYGGEEFALLLPRTDLAGAVEVGNRLRERVASQPVGCPDGTVVPVTISVGAAAHPAHGPTVASVVAAADAALYAAKRAGRNQVRPATDGG